MKIATTRLWKKSYPQLASASKALNEKLVRSELEPEGFNVPLRNLRIDLRIFREANLPLQTEESKLGLDYSKVIGAQTVEWEGQEVTLVQLAPVQHDPDREKREQAWKLAMGRRLQDRDALNSLWNKFLDLRDVIQECRCFKLHGIPLSAASPFRLWSGQRNVQNAIEESSSRRPGAFRTEAPELGLDLWRPWDVDVDAFGREPLKPFDQNRGAE